jgi:hypothetical protein
MITLDTTNGHNKEVVDNFNKVAKSFDESGLLSIILVNWCDDRDLTDITTHLNNLIVENNLVVLE